MSSHLYATCLIYGGGRGVAKVNNEHVELTDNPVLCGQRLLSIYYVPGRLFEIRRKYSDPSHGEMTPEEIAAADALLRELCP